MNIDSCNFLLEKIINRIDTSPDKKITFAEYMDLCLYEWEYGYYTSNDIKIGTQGDFFTSTSISPDFAQLLGIQLHQIWEISGKPQPFYLVEMGAGEGTLASNILVFLSEYYPDFIENLEYIIIEKSDALKDKQKCHLSKNLPESINVKL